MAERREVAVATSDPVSSLPTERRRGAISAAVAPVWSRRGTMSRAASAADDGESAGLLRDADAGLGLVGMWKHDGNAVAA